MNYYQDHAMEAMVKGWTRVDMLIALYDRTMAAIRGVQLAEEANDAMMAATQRLEAHRLLLGLHCGLNTDEYPLAADVARLLNFVSRRFDEKNYDEAIRFLEKLHSSFSQIRDEAAQLEQDGKIPPLMDTPGLNTFA